MVASPARDAVEAGAEKGHPGSDDVGVGQRHDPGAPFGGVVAGGQLALGFAGRRSPRGISTFQLSGRPAASDMAVMTSRWRSSKSWMVGMNSSWVPGKSRSTPDRRDELVGGGRPGRHRVAVSVPMRRRPRRREAHAAGGQPVAEQRPHGLELVGRGRLADRVGTHHHPPQGRVADHEPHVDDRPGRLDPRRGTRPVLRQFHGTPAARVSSGMPSTRASMRIR